MWYGRIGGACTVGLVKLVLRRFGVDGYLRRGFQEASLDTSDWATNNDNGKISFILDNPVYQSPSDQSPPSTFAARRQRRSRSDGK